MLTTHKFYFINSKDIKSILDGSVNLIITSPPYPMIEMWDDIMGQQNQEISKSLTSNRGYEAFELMHQELDKVWDEMIRIVKDGSFICINIGDATRTINNDFYLYPNHSRIINHFRKRGLNNLPNIIWRKQTNSPNKFMGSGMLPAGAYVTLEHEHILIFRKGSKREFKSEADKQLRRESSFFWEERNIWFSDVWDFKGVKQVLNNKNSRERSAAFPFELPYRLINMYSVKGDVVLDPFVGTGTTSLAAILTGRNSIGVDIDTHLMDNISDQLNSSNLIHNLNLIVQSRLLNHISYISTKEAVKHINQNYKFPVITNQEKELLINYVKTIIRKDNSFEVDYYEDPLIESPTIDQTKLF